jgi:virginiamycin B lyase
LFRFGETLRMRTLGRYVLTIAVFFVAFAGSGAIHKAVPVTPLRLAYDQVEIALFFSPGEKTVDSPPGSFERDYRWATTHTGDTEHEYATLHHVSYFDGWTRVETAQSIQLANRQRRIVIIADKDTATFRRYTGAQAQAMLDPGRRSQYGTVAATAIVAEPGSAVYSSRVKYVALPAITLDGMRAFGRRTFEMAEDSGATGSCASGLLSLVGYRALTVTTEYRAPFAEPSSPPFHLKKTDHRIIDLCHVRVARATEPAAQRLFDEQFLFYKREEYSAIEHGRSKLLFSDITERGHVHALGGKDRGLLDLPPRYVDGCSRRPVPSDCEPLATYAELKATLLVSHVGGGLGRVIQARDGSIWFSERDRDRLGRIGADNVVHEITLPVGTKPEGLTETPDGTIWFTETGFGMVGGRHSGIGSYAPNGAIAEPVTFKKGQDIGGIDSANDGTVWFSHGGDNGAVSLITPTGAVKHFPLDAGSMPAELRLGPDGHPWVAEFGTGSIVRVTPQGQITRLPLHTKGDGPFGLAFARSALWFTAAFNVGYLDMNNQIHIFTVPRSDGGADDIVALPNGEAAFTEHIGRIGIVSPRGNFVEFTVPGKPDGILLDKDGNLWYTDQDSVRMIPKFLQVTQAATQSL